MNIYTTVVCEAFKPRFEFEGHWLAVHILTVFGLTSANTKVSVLSVGRDF